MYQVEGKLLFNDLYSVGKLNQLIWLHLEFQIKEAQSSTDICQLYTIHLYYYYNSSGNVVGNVVLWDKMRCFVQYFSLPKKILTCIIMEYLYQVLVIFYCISVRIDQDFNNYINQFLLILFQSVMLCYTYIRCGLGLAALAHVRREELLLVLLWDLLTSSRVRPVTLGLIWTQKIN